MSLFGNPASSTPSFSFGGPSAATPAAGTASAAFSNPAAATGPSLFGAAASATSAVPSLFGAQPSTPSLFGATATPSQPLFGAAASSTATPSLFGGANAAASAPSIFGAASAPSFAGATASSLFGAGASTPSLFGTGAAGSTFGASQQQQQQQSTLFGGGSFGATQQQPAAQQQQQQQQQVGPLGVAVQADLAAVREIEALKDAFTGGPAHPRYRFACLLLNVVDDPAARQKPPGVDDLVWREALQKAGGADNPDRLWPVLASGFASLLQREAAQDGAIEEHRARLGAAAAAVRELAQRREALLSGRLEAARRREAQLGQQLLRLARQVDALEGRFAAAMGHRPPAAAAAARDVTERLTVLEKALHPTSAAGLPRRVARAGARVGEGAAAAEEARADAQDEQPADLDSTSLRNLLSLLKQQQSSLSALEAVLQGDNRDLAIMLDDSGEAAPMAILPACQA